MEALLLFSRLTGAITETRSFDPREPDGHPELIGMCIVRLMGSGCLVFGLGCLSLAFMVGGGGNGGVIDETTLKGMLFLAAGGGVVMGLSMLLAPEGQSGSDSTNEAAPWP